MSCNLKNLNYLKIWENTLIFSELHKHISTSFKALQCCIALIVLSGAELCFIFTFKDVGLNLTGRIQIKILTDMLCRVDSILLKAVNF